MIEKVFLIVLHIKLVKIGSVMLFKKNVDQYQSYDSRVFRRLYQRKKRQLLRYLIGVCGYQYYFQLPFFQTFLC